MKPFFVARWSSALPLLAPLVWALCAAASVGIARAQSPTPCNIELGKKQWTTPPAEKIVAQGNAVQSANCPSLLQIIAMLGSSTKKTAGRKLEGDQPLDMAAAQAERTKALGDPAVQQDLAEELVNETDPLWRVLREAAVLHEHGYFKARDLLIEPLRGGSK